jgi:hypothetical protein
MPDHPKESVGARYRRLAGECWEIAHTFAAGERRTVLLQMAQVWQRLADEQRHVPELAEVRTPPPVTEQIRPVVQQQQQVQPKDDEKKK